MVTHRVPGSGAPFSTVFSSVVACLVPSATTGWHPWVQAISVDGNQPDCTRSCQRSSFSGDCHAGCARLLLPAGWTSRVSCRSRRTGCLLVQRVQESKCVAGDLVSIVFCNRAWLLECHPGGFVSLGLLPYRCAGAQGRVCKLSWQFRYWDFTRSSPSCHTTAQAQTSRTHVPCHANHIDVREDHKTKPAAFTVAAV